MNAKNSIPIFINSSERNNGSINDFKISLNNVQPQTENYKILLKEMRLTNNIYNINSYNNVIDLGTTTIPLPENQYNATQFIAYINNKDSVPLSITASYDSQSRKLLFHNNTGTIYTLTSTSKQKFLGLPAGQYTLGTTLMSNQPVNFSGTDFVRVETDIPLESYNTLNYNKNVLDVIYLDTDFESDLIYKNDYAIQTYTNEINEINIRLMDENRDPLQLKSEYQMKLLLFNSDE